jgi:hypothetical protein
MTTIRERDAAPHDDLKWTVEMQDRRALLAALDRLVEAASVPSGMQAGDWSRLRAALAHAKEISDGISPGE